MLRVVRPSRHAVRMPRRVPQKCADHVLTYTWRSSPTRCAICLAGIKDARFFDEAILVSIAASVPTDFIASQLGREAGVIRVMPQYADAGR